MSAQRSIYQSSTLTKNKVVLGELTIADFLVKCTTRIRVNMYHETSLVELITNFLAVFIQRRDYWYNQCLTRI